MLAATLTCGLMTLTSCQGLVDAVFGEDAQPAESSKPSTDPEKPTTFDAKTTPLTLEALVANTVVTIKLMDGIELSSVEYSTDGTTWTALSSDPQEIKLAAVGDKVMLRGANGSYATDKDATRITCSSDGAATRGATRSLENKAKCVVYGNTRSMLKKEGFSTINDLADPYTFRQFFKEAGIDIDQAKALLLPDGNMSVGCFMEMFKGNTDMTNTPVLGAKTMVPKCFQEIFAGCSNVSEVVMLATEVAAGATVKDCAKDWLKDTGKDCDVPLALVVCAESNFPFEDLLEDTGDNWVVVDAETEEIIPTGIEIKWGEEGEVLDIDEETEIGMTVGDEEALTATLLPKEAEGEVELSVSDDEILSIENGKVKALKAGTATIKATYTNGDKEISVSFKVVVSAAQEAQGVNAINPFEDGGDPLDTEQS